MEGDASELFFHSSPLKIMMSRGISKMSRDRMSDGADDRVLTSGRRIGLSQTKVVSPVLKMLTHCDGCRSGQSRQRSLAECGGIGCGYYDVVSFGMEVRERSTLTSPGGRLQHPSRDHGGRHCDDSCGMSNSTESRDEAS